MKDLVAYLARSLAGRPDEVTVSDSVSDKGVIVELKVADEDLNHLIGKQGRTVKAMRSLLAASSAKDGRRFFLKISSNSLGESEGLQLEDETGGDSEPDLAKDDDG